MLYNCEDMKYTDCIKLTRHLQLCLNKLLLVSMKVGANSFLLRVKVKMVVFYFFIH